MPPNWLEITPLDATLTGHLTCVANKGLAHYVSALDATLTKNGGGYRRRYRQQDSRSKESLLKAPRRTTRKHSDLAGKDLFPVRSPIVTR